MTETVVDRLRESLTRELASLARAGKLGALTPDMYRRFLALARYAASCGADAILFTCSAFGPCIEACARDLAPLPVLKPNEAMFQVALASGKTIGMLATFAPSVGTMTDEFDEYVAQAGVKATLTTIVVKDAIDLLRKGDADSHNRLVAERAPELAHCDAIMLAHFSTSRAAAAVRERVTVPVLTAPHAAVERMRALVEGPSRRG